MSEQLTKHELVLRYVNEVRRILGKKAPADPWSAVGLEWETTSPPPTQNFLTPPVVTTEAYDYTVRSARAEVPVGG